MSTVDDYEAIADVYDSFKGDRQEPVQLLIDIMWHHRPKIRRVLELACGTGAVLEGLSRLFDVTGLDVSPSMLRQARRRLPAVRLFEADMTTFTIGQKFNAVYCIHNSMNHLNTISDWQAVFERVAAHLTTDGIFIFDVNTPERMEAFVANSPGVYWAGNTRFTTWVTRLSKEIEGYAWGTEIVRRKRFGGHAVHNMSIKVLSPTADQIKDMLMPYFTVDHTFLYEAQNYHETGRTYYICVKR